MKTQCITICELQLKQYSGGNVYIRVLNACIKKERLQMNGFVFHIKEITKRPNETQDSFKKKYLRKMYLLNKLNNVQF